MLIQPTKFSYTEMRMIVEGHKTNYSRKHEPPVRWKSKCNCVFSRYYSGTSRHLSIKIKSVVQLPSNQGILNEMSNNGTIMDDKAIGIALNYALNNCNVAGIRGHMTLG